MFAAGAAAAHRSSMPRVVLHRRPGMRPVPMLRLRQQQLRSLRCVHSLSRPAAPQRRQHSCSAPAAAAAAAEHDSLDMQRHTTYDLAEWHSRASPDVQRILTLALAETSDVSAADAGILLGGSGADAHATLAVADELRRRAVGDDVTYVVNRNIVSTQSIPTAA